MIFEDIVLSWGDEEYTIGGDDKIMRLIAMIEEEVTLQELSAGNPQLTKVSRAYQKALKFAGAEVSVAEVYASLFGNSAANITATITGLIAMMVPPAAMREHLPKKKE